VTKTEKLYEVLKQKRLMRARDIVNLGVSSEFLRKITAQGKILKVGYGIYAHPDYEPLFNDDLAQVSLRMPNGIICLKSALFFHGLTNLMPHEIWMAVGDNRKPSKGDIPVKTVFMSGKAFSSGMFVYDAEGVGIKVYCPAKTIADCFKFRNKTGLDIAIESLREYLAKNIGTVDEIWYYAEILRVSEIIRPYMEAMI
jgi:predicted transcriptional regulator of viral defense system